MSGEAPAYLREHPDGCTLAIRVQPGAKRTAVAGVYGEGQQAQLKIAVHAPPVDGRANDALIGYLAELFRLPRSSVGIASGHGSRSKVLALKGIKLDEVRRAISSLLAQAG